MAKIRKNIVHYFRIVDSCIIYNYRLLWPHYNALRPVSDYNVLLASTQSSVFHQLSQVTHGSSLVMEAKK